MRFIEDNFESLSQLYRIQLKKNIIPAESFDEVTRHKGDIGTRRLSAFKILRPVGDDYRIAEKVGASLGFLMQEFKPLLPVQLRRYHTLIKDIYELLTIRSAPERQRFLLNHLINIRPE